MINEVNERQVVDSNLSASIEKITNKLFEQDEKFRGFITLDNEEQIRNYILSDEGRKDWKKSREKKQRGSRIWKIYCLHHQLSLIS